jgi:CheY-like chemotaxis protein
LPTIFDPFRHGAERPRSRTTRGLGLGLFIVDQIVRAHGGSIEVTSEDLEGTTFKMRIPRRCELGGAILRTHNAGAAESRNALVMVVDDDEDVRIGMTDILEKRGFQAVVAADGHEALQLLEAGARPRLILLDLSMPRMSGEEFCDKLQDNPALAHIPVVIVSADTAAALRLSRERAKAFLAKPVSLDQLLAAIDAIH